MMRQLSETVCLWRSYVQYSPNEVSILLFVLEAPGSRPGNRLLIWAFIIVTVWTLLTIYTTHWWTRTLFGMSLWCFSDDGGGCLGVLGKEKGQSFSISMTKAVFDALLKVKFVLVRVQWCVGDHRFNSWC